MHNKHVCPEYAGDCKDQFPVFSPVGINKKDLDGMIPVFSTIGRGPRGEGVTVKQLGDGSYQFISTTTGEVVSEVPVLDVGTFEVINNTPNPVGGEPISVTIRHTFGGEVKKCDITIPSGANGASIHTCSALLDKNESNRYSLLRSSFTTTPLVRDSVIFKTVDGEDEFLTFGEIYSVAAGTVGVNALSYLGAGWDSPNIGNNGNWWVGNSDTGIPATGPKGDGLPEGGEVGQVMTKTESGPMWADASAPRAGFIYVNPSDVLPDGFLWCDGSEHSRTEYPELFAAIGTTFGAGDGLTTFNVPDMRGRVPVGAGDGYALGATGGEATHTLTIDEMPSHNHELREGADNTAGSTWESYTPGSGIMRTATHAMLKKGGDQPHNNMQPYAVVNYVIATGQGTGVSVAEVVQGVTALPLAVEYGGTGANTATGARANLGIADSIIEEGLTNSWHYVKYANGLAMCWTDINSGSVVAEAWDNVAYYDYTETPAFPFEFTIIPYVMATSTTSLWWVSVTNISKKGIGVIRGFKTNTSAKALAANVFALGRWK